MTPIDATLLVTLFALRFAPLDMDMTVSAADYDVAEVKCLAQMVYHESRARDMPEATELAHATLARVGKPYGGSTVCEVIAKPGQYPWHKKRDKIDDLESWKRSVDAAALAYTDLVPARYQATHFDICGRNPQPWKKKLPKAGRVNVTCFWEGK
jgi:spore germination cell wall hydrolase CwlJ-like protein